MLVLVRALGTRFIVGDGATCLDEDANQEGGDAAAAASRWGVWGGARRIACTAPTFPPNLMKRVRSERLAEAEVESVGVLVGPLRQWEADVEAKQPERRIVAKADANGVTQIEVYVPYLREHVAGVVEHGRPQPGPRVAIPQLLVDDDHRLAAQGQVVGSPRPERVDVESPHAVGAAGLEEIVERNALAAEDLDEAEAIPVGPQHRRSSQDPGQRELGELLREVEVRAQHLRRHEDVQAQEGAARRVQRVVPRVA